MILPNKLIPFEKSVLYKTICILEALKVNNIPVSDLFMQVQDYFEDVTEFIIGLDVLFALEKIVYDENQKVIKYVRKN